MNASPRQALIEEAVRLWTDEHLPPSAFRTRAAGDLTFSLMFFSAAASETATSGAYDLVHAVAGQADALGFPALWLPERHFHRFGGPYPDPGVLAASLAHCTRHIRLRAGSVVLPLHHPARIAETWAMVDALSNGRVDIAFGSGWNPNDFLLAPQNFDANRAVLHRDVDTVRRLWRGEAVSFANGRGEPVATRTFPRPVQPELPVWISSTGSTETFVWAGSQGFNLLTMLIGADLDALAGKITQYRAARQQAGHDPAGGTVTLMLHTLVHTDGERVRREIRAPFLDYVRSSLDVQRHGHAEGAALTEAQREQMVAFAYERYTRSAALFGTPAECAPMLHRAAAAGVTEIACLLDFGAPDALVLEGLAPLAALAGLRPRAVSVAAAVARAAEPVAIIGMAGRFPDARDVGTFWRNLQAGRESVTPPPPGRGTALPRGGFLDDVETFDAAGFGIAPAEAAAMDPHHRLLLHAARDALADAGADPAALRGSDTGVFVALYSSSFAASRTGGAAPDGVEIAGQVASMAPNRLSFLYDWSGPSELVNTACSSGLVAIHRAVAALQAGECRLALAAGVSLLLSDAESAALAGLGIISPTGICRAFDRDADGQVRGEGVGVLVLKPLASALRDGDGIYAVVTGTAVNHSGGRGGSLTLPNPRRQAACMAAALARAGIGPEVIGYVEAHGAGTAAGDLAELSALDQVFLQGCAVGSVKPNIGALDAAGGIAATIKAALMLHHGAIPATLHRQAAPETRQASRLRFPTQCEDWAQPDAGPRQALVHAYGLGGVNAALVLAEHPGPHRRTAAAAAPSRGVVGSFYDFVTRPDMAEVDLYLTLAPFADIVPGFSWTRTFQDPQRHPAHWQLMQAAQREMREVLFAPVDFARVRRVMDIGCGLGTDLIALARRHPALRGVGYTISAAQAEQAQRRIAAAGLAARLAVHHRDSAADPFPGPFDLMIGFEVAHHIRDKDALFANISRHLAPGGTLVLADTIASTVAPIDLPQVGSWTLDRASYADLFSRHGLRLIQCIDASAEIANFLADPELEPMLAAEAAAANAVGRVGMDVAAAVQRSWHAFGTALREGLMRYALIAAVPDAPSDALARHNRAQVDA